MAQININGIADFMAFAGQVGVADSPASAAISGAAKTAAAGLAAQHAADGAAVAPAVNDDGRVVAHAYTPLIGTETIPIGKVVATYDHCDNQCCAYLCDKTAGCRSFLLRDADAHCVLSDRCIAPGDAVQTSAFNTYVGLEND